MNNKKARIFNLLLIAASTILCASARGEKEGDFIYAIKDNSATITRYTGNGGSVTIPDRLGGMPVAAIISPGFAASKITAITIPTSVVAIEEVSLSGCAELRTIKMAKDHPRFSSVDGVLFDKNLTTLLQCPGAMEGSYVVPSSVKAIGHAAFAGCSKITKLQLPQSLSDINLSALSGMDSLKEFVVDPKNTVFRSTNGILFSSSGTKLVKYPTGIIGNYEVPAGVIEIEEAAFEGCHGLSKVLIPNSVLKIGDGAFRRCDSLEDVNIPRGVVEISYGAFEKCNKLVSVSMPGTEKIGFRSFNSCQSLKDISFPPDLHEIGLNAFSNCENLVKVVIPSKVRIINDGAFIGCRNLAEVYFQGDAPHNALKGGTEASIFRACAPKLAIRYFKNSAGFTTPNWNGFKTIELDPAKEYFEWVAADERKLKAKFIKLSDASIIVEKEDGKQLVIPFAKLAPTSVEQAKRIAALVK